MNSHRSLLVVQVILSPKSAAEINTVFADLNPFRSESPKGGNSPIGRGKVEAPHGMYPVSPSKALAGNNPFNIPKGNDVTQQGSVNQGAGGSVFFGAGPNANYFAWQQPQNQV